MKTVAIVGSHPFTRSAVPWGDESIDIWVFNEAVGQGWVPRCNAVLQMHLPPVYRNPQNRTDPNHWVWLQKPHPYPIYMQDVDPDVPASVRYPLDTIAGQYLPGLMAQDGQAIRFFTSSIAYAIALALYQGYKRILIYGIEMASDTEYVYQRDCVTFWVGVALGHGADVVLCSAQSIFDRPLYGYQGEVTYAPTYFETRLDELLPKLEVELSAYNTARSSTDGAFETQPVSPAAILTALQVELEAAARLGTIQGCVDEAKRYIGKVNAMITEAGAAMISRQEFEGRTAHAMKAHETAKSAMDIASGSARYVWEAWCATHNPLALTQLRQYASEQIAAAQHVGYSRGVHTENSRYATDLDNRIKAAGGEKSIEPLMNAARS